MTQERSTERFNMAPQWVKSYHIAYENEAGNWTDILDASQQPIVRINTLLLFCKEKYNICMLVKSTGVYINHRETLNYSKGKFSLMSSIPLHFIERFGVRGILVSNSKNLRWTQSFSTINYSSIQGGGDYMTGLVQTSSETTRSWSSSPLIVSRDFFSHQTWARFQPGGA